MEGVEKGSAVVDLMHSMAKRDTTLRKGAIAIRRIKFVEGAHVGDNDSQHIIDIASHAVELHYLRHFGNALSEAL
jgi:hypothetical protein